jgi:hypothetical protein
MKYLFLILVTCLIVFASCTKDCEICTREFMKRRGYYNQTYPVKYTYTDNNGVNQITKRFYSAKELCKFNECK